MHRNTERRLARLEAQHNVARADPGRIVIVDIVGLTPQEAEERIAAADQEAGERGKVIVVGCVDDRGNNITHDLDRLRELGIRINRI